MSTAKSTGLKEQIADGVVVEGTVSPGFELVADQFLENFRSRGELGASLCVTVGGETRLDLWGGIADSKTGRAWERDTISIVFSCTKGATALCAHVLASRFGWTPQQLGEMTFGQILLHLQMLGADADGSHA